MAAPLPQAVKMMLASRDHRLKHYIWHGVRNLWLQMDADQRQAILTLYPGWEPPRPALDANQAPMRDNNSGEDFLYMHRQMIAMVNENLAQIADPNYPQVVGWPSLPLPGDPDFPVPDYPGLDADQKTDAYFHDPMQVWEAQYTSQNYLQSVTLGQLGSDIEMTIHNDMHVRWAAPTPLGRRPGDLFNAVDPRWDDVAYDDLLDTYSSHVNDVFWKLHGWVDDRIEQWKQVNNVQGPIQWQGTWIGPHDADHHPMFGFRAALQTTPDDLDRLNQVARILTEAGFDGFFRARRGR
jgi:hypothetical protein